MVVMAALVWLPIRWLAVASLATIALHNWLDGVTAAQFGEAAGLWNVLHQPGPFRFLGRLFIVGYPLVPWVAVMAAGFCSGPLFRLDPPARQRILVRTGCAAILVFAIVRALNGYGDPAPWSAQRSTLYTALSFLNTSKYPPSLDFLLMTLGPALLALAWLDRRQPGSSNPLVIFGRVPLFYFVLHFYLAHVAAMVLAWFRYGQRLWPSCFIRCRRWVAHGHCFLQTSGTTSGLPMSCGPSS